MLLHVVLTLYQRVLVLYLKIWLHTTLLCVFCIINMAVGSPAQEFKTVSGELFPLKSLTVLLRSDLLSDFGFAQYMSPWDEQSVLRGSPLYMAPEMVCRRQYDSRVDLWSVGVILYGECFTFTFHIQKRLKKETQIPST